MGLLDSLEAQVETLDGVSEGTERDEIDACLSVREHGVVGDAAR